MAKLSQWAGLPGQHTGLPELEVRHEQVEFSTALPQPDPRWTYTDCQGHEHAYGTADEPYPTLAVRYGEPFWDAEAEEEDRESWLACPQCEEKIQPATVVDTNPRYVPGRTEYLVYGEPVSPEEGERLLALHEAAEKERRRAARARQLAPLADAMRAENIDPGVVARVITRLED